MAERHSSHARFREQECIALNAGSTPCMALCTTILLGAVVTVNRAGLGFQAETAHGVLLSFTQHPLAILALPHLAAGVTVSHVHGRDIGDDVVVVGEPLSPPTKSLVDIVCPRDVALARSSKRPQCNDGGAEPGLQRGGDDGGSGCPLRVTDDKDALLILG